MCDKQQSLNIKALMEMEYAIQKIFFLPSPPPSPFTHSGFHVSFHLVFLAGKKREMEIVKLILNWLPDKRT